MSNKKHREQGKEGTRKHRTGFKAECGTVWIQIHRADEYLKSELMERENVQNVLEQVRSAFTIENSFENRNENLLKDFYINSIRKRYS